ncbi:MAG: SMC-Scp complex subunit ScpB [Candidatus Marsarchaeota archaeon]|nr:SMC-Scp complex subunit ScpB [Candidatus Marsarchaeota archaeon]MCL5102350.1 SMC-Scp complex subunit ScpB [Candidatus Marsarchaeota archaeon]
MVEVQKDSVKLIEAVLFVSGRAMGLDEIAEATGIASKGYIEEAIKKLGERYSSDDTALTVVSIGGKYMISLKEPYGSRVNSLAGAPEISKAALRILAYISKKEPIMQSDVVKAFGSSVYEQMKELKEKDFVKTEAYGRTKKITTTQKFREYFNV